MNPRTVWKGSGRCLLNYTETFDPTSGWVYNYSYVGTDAEIDAFMRTLARCATRVSHRKENDQHFLDVTTSTPLEPGAFTDLPCEIYDFSTEFSIDEIWTNPRIIMMTDVDLITGTEKVKALHVIKTIGLWKHFVTSRANHLYNGYIKRADEVKPSQETLDKIGDGMGPTPPHETGLLDDAGNPVADAVADFGSASLVVNLYNIYTSYVMGNTVWQSRRQVLSRRKVIAAQSGEKIIIDAIEKVWDTPAFIIEFQIPTDIQARLPDDPPFPPPGWFWGWKTRRLDSAIVSRSGRYEETEDWIFALWCEMTHEIIKTPSSP
jgi:hypothetical protein